MGRWWKGCLALGLVWAVLLAGCGGGGQSSPEAVLTRFVTLLNQSKGDEAMELVAPEYRSRVSSGLGMWAGIIRMAGVRFIGVTVKVLDAQGDQAHLRYQERFNPNIYDSTGTARLARRDGKWWIISLE